MRYETIISATAEQKLGITKEKILFIWLLMDKVLHRVENIKSLPNELRSSSGNA